MDDSNDAAAEAVSTPGGAYRLAVDEETAWWFTNALVMVKAGGPETKQRLTVVEILYPAGLLTPDAPAFGGG